MKPHFMQFVGEGLADFVKEHLTLLSNDLCALNDILILLGIEIFHCYILKFALEE